MRGYPEYNFPAFDAAEARWKAAGWHVISPAATSRALGYGPLRDLSDADARRLLYHVTRIDLENVMASSAIALLPGWERSRLGTVELSLALALGLSVYNAETMNELDPLPTPWKHVAELSQAVDALRAALRSRGPYAPSLPQL
jgi:hypothetical protein